MKKYALLIIVGVMLTFSSCSKDEWDNMEEETESKEVNPVSDPIEDWDKGRYSIQIENDGNLENTDDIKRPDAT